MTEEEAIEKRLLELSKVYSNLDSILDNIPDALPFDVKQKVKDAILNNKDLKELMDGIENHRPPRFFLLGRTGVGKSSLINALCDSYIAPVSDVNSCTKDIHVYDCYRSGRVLMQICDTRGFAEIQASESEDDVQEQLIESVNQFSPDIALFVIDGTRRDDVLTDIKFLKRLARVYMEQYDQRLPIIVVVNKCDGVAPSRIKVPAEYTQNKINNINEKVIFYKDIIDANGLSINKIIPVSSYIDWQTSEGREVTAKEIKNMTPAEIEKLEIAFDGRYNIEQLFDFLEEAIYDYQARMGLRMVKKFRDVLYRVAKSLCKSFSALSAAIGGAPIILHDIFYLFTIQIILVLLIEALSGREANFDSAKEFVVGLLGVAATGVGLRAIAQQLSKLANKYVPILGNTISAGIAYSGTKLIGEAAIQYFIDEEPIENVREKYRKASLLLPT